MKVLLVFLLLITTAIANIVIPQNINKIHNFKIESFYDKTNSLNIQNVKNEVFKQTPSQFTFGYKKGNFWFKFTILNKSKKNKFILFFNEPYYEHLNLYTKKNAVWIEDKNGASINLKNRSTQYYNPAFELTINPNETKTYYVKGNSKITSSGEFEIFEKEYFNSYGRSYDFLYMFYFGIITFITLLSIFMFLKLKELVYLYYAGYIFFYALWVAGYSGLIFYTSLSLHYHKYLMVTSMWVMFLILFSSEFLNVRKYLLNIYKPLNIFGYLFGVLAILIVVSFEPWFEIMHAISSLVFIILFTISLMILRQQNDKNIKYYLIAMSVYMLTMTLMAFMSNGWIENNDINRYSFLYGSLFEIVFFTLLLTNRFYIFQNEKLSIQKELLDFKSKNEVILENKIQQRTQEISEAYTKVDKLSKERGILLKELHHRVKNNFHMIMGLLWFEEKNTNENKAKFQDIRNRIKYMSMLHEKLYVPNDLTNISIKEYLDDIINNYKNMKMQILLNYDIQNILLQHEEVHSLGIIVNEVINNSIKHNPLFGKLSLNIRLYTKGEKVILSIKDNGSGFNKSMLNEGMGFILIKNFSNNLLNSFYEFNVENGVEFRLTFESAKPSG